MKQHKYYQKAITWMSRKGFSNIKSKTEHYETPTAYHHAAQTDRTFTPDITGRKRAKKSYFEIVNSKENVQKKLSKWKLLSTLAAMKGGEFILFATKGHKAFVERQIKKHNLNVKLVYLPNI